MNRLLFYSFTFIHFSALGLMYIMSSFLKKRKTAKGIAALPYYPATWPGGKDRIADWKPFFEDKDISYDVYPCWTKEDILKFYESEKNGNSGIRYSIYFKIYFKRMRLLRKLKNYETIWIQRSYVPMFPFKDAYYEKFISRIHPNVIYDFYDADYESNEKLVFNTVKAAKSVTVASTFLKEKFEAYNQNVHFIRYAIDVSQFKLPKTKSSEGLTIGWMGSPANAAQLSLIANQLKDIEHDYPNVSFSFVCRDLPDLGLTRFTVQKWGDQGFDYHVWLSTLDIGIVPFISQNDTTRAKISMKSLEFMAAGVAQISSPWVHSDTVVPGESILIAHENEWSHQISKFILNTELRKSCSVKSLLIFEKNHTFKNVYDSLQRSLVP